MQDDNTFQFLSNNNKCILLDGCNIGEVFGYPPLGGDDTYCISLEGQYNTKLTFIRPILKSCYRLPHNFILILNTLCSLISTPI